MGDDHERRRRRPGPLQLLAVRRPELQHRHQSPGFAATARQQRADGGQLLSAGRDQLRRHDRPRQQRPRGSDRHGRPARRRGRPRDRDRSGLLGLRRRLLRLRRHGGRGHPQHRIGAADHPGLLVRDPPRTVDAAGHHGPRQLHQQQLGPATGFRDHGHHRLRAGRPGRLRRLAVDQQRRGQPAQRHGSPGGRRHRGGPRNRPVAAVGQQPIRRAVGRRQLLLHG